MSNHFKNTYAGFADGFIGVTELPSGRTTFFPINDLDAAQTYMVNNGASGNVYHNWNVCGRAPEKGRGRAEDFVASPGVFFDLDLKSIDPSVHSKNEKLPETLESALSIVIDAGLPEPTALVHSGNGAYAQYLFTEPYVFDDEASREEAKKLFVGLHSRFAEAFHARGFQIDNVSDLPRITRSPGTLNHKTDPAKPVTLLSFDNSRRYERGFLASLVRPKKAITRTQRSGLSTSRSDVLLEQMEQMKPNLDSVRLGCAWVNQCIDSFDRLSEPEWFAMASIVEPCFGGAEKFHKLSSQDPRYDPLETEGKLGRAGGPRTCNRIHTDFQFEGCSECAFWGGEIIKSPLQLGTRPPKIAELMASHVYAVDRSKYVKISTGTSLGDREFSDKHRAFTGKTTPHTLLNLDTATRKVDGITYLPGVFDRIVTDDDGDDFFNTWRPSRMKPSEGSFEIIEDHLSYIIGDENERNHYLNALSHCVQKPGVKIKHVLAISGGQGTGKSFLGSLMRVIVGIKNSYTAVGVDFISEWSKPLSNIHLLLAEEFKTDSRTDAYETLKAIITEDTTTVNEKHEPRHVAKTPRIILAFANSDNPINIAPDDRRFFLVKSRAVPREPSYYARLWNDGLAQAPAFYHFLMTRDISHFDASATPPMTEAKRQLVQSSRPACVRELEMVIAEGEAPFYRDLVTREEVHLAVRARSNSRANVSATAVADAMKELGFVQLPQVRLPGAGGHRPRLWAWRNKEVWLSATASQIGEEMQKRREFYVGAFA
ncbi:virulence-associated E family protein [Mesorhizobium sp. M0092]|uniref:primase-helicase family protein n=1 Tax=Mesorhizobium sp. M0092 TaxID=2956876 RepID=UPI0033393CB5